MTLPVIAPGEQVIELMIPASKVGLIIGKYSCGILSVIKVDNTLTHKYILIIVILEKNINALNFLMLLLCYKSQLHNYLLVCF